MHLLSLQTTTTPLVDASTRFTEGAFWNRCRPGLSHHGRRGLALRDAGRQAAQQFAAVLEPVAAPFGPCVLPATPIIEAFPNAFRGVLLPAASFAGWSTALGKAKSDWLYKQLVEGFSLEICCQIRSGFAVGTQKI